MQLSCSCSTFVARDLHIALGLICSVTSLFHCPSCYSLGNIASALIPRILHDDPEKSVHDVAKIALMPHSPHPETIVTDFRETRQYCSTLHVGNSYNSYNRYRAGCGGCRLYMGYGFQLSIIHTIHIIHTVHTIDIGRVAGNCTGVLGPAIYTYNSYNSYN